MAHRTYAVVIERGEANLSAYVPDLPGCVATGATEEEVVGEITSAIRLHLDGMREDGDPIPPPHTTARMIEIDSAAA